MNFNPEDIRARGLGIAAPVEGWPEPPKAEPAWLTKTNEALRECDAAAGRKKIKELTTENAALQIITGVLLALVFVLGSFILGQESMR